MKGKTQDVQERLRTNVRALLHAKYENAFTFYFSKPINELLSNAPIPHVAHFKEYLFIDDCNEYLKRFYHRNEQPDRIDQLTDFYATSLPNPQPTHYSLDFAVLMIKRSQTHANFFYKLQQQQQQQQEMLLQEQNPNPEHLLHFNPSSFRIGQSEDNPADFFLQTMTSNASSRIGTQLQSFQRLPQSSQLQQQQQQQQNPSKQQYPFACYESPPSEAIRRRKRSHSISKFPLDAKKTNEESNEIFDPASNMHPSEVIESNIIGRINNSNSSQEYENNKQRSKKGNNNNNNDLEQLINWNNFEGELRKSREGFHFQPDKKQEATQLSESSQILREKEKDNGLFFFEADDDDIPVIDANNESYHRINNHQLSIAELEPNSSSDQNDDCAAWEGLIDGNNNNKHDQHEFSDDLDLGIDDRNGSIDEEQFDHEDNYYNNNRMDTSNKDQKGNSNSGDDLDKVHDLSEHAKSESDTENNNGEFMQGSFMKELEEFEKEISFDTNSFDIYNPEYSDEYDDDVLLTIPQTTRPRRLSIERLEKELYEEISSRNITIESEYIRQKYIIDFSTSSISPIVNNNTSVTPSLVPTPPSGATANSNRNPLSPSITNGQVQRSEEKQKKQFKQVVPFDFLKKIQKKHAAKISSIISHQTSQEIASAQQPLSILANQPASQSHFAGVLQQHPLNNPSSNSGNCTERAEKISSSSTSKSTVHLGSCGNGVTNQQKQNPHFFMPQKQTSSYHHRPEFSKIPSNHVSSSTGENTQAIIKSNASVSVSSPSDYNTHIYAKQTGIAKVLSPSTFYPLSGSTNQEDPTSTLRRLSKTICATKNRSTLKKEQNLSIQQQNQQHLQQAQPQQQQQQQPFHHYSQTNQCRIKQQPQFIVPTQCTATGANQNQTSQSLTTLKRYDISNGANHFASIAPTTGNVHLPEEKSGSTTYRSSYLGASLNSGIDTNLKQQHVISSEFLRQFNWHNITNSNQNESPISTSISKQSNHQAGGLSLNFSDEVISDEQRPQFFQPSSQKLHMLSAAIPPAKQTVSEKEKQIIIPHHHHHHHNLQHFQSRKEEIKQEEFPAGFNRVGSSEQRVKIPSSNSAASMISQLLQHSSTATTFSNTAATAQQSVTTNTSRIKNKSLDHTSKAKSSISHSQSSIAIHSNHHNQQQSNNNNNNYHSPTDSVLLALSSQRLGKTLQQAANSGSLRNSSENQRLSDQQQQQYSDRNGSANIKNKFQSPNPLFFAPNSLSALILPEASLQNSVGRKKTTSKKKKSKLSTNTSEQNLPFELIPSTFRSQLLPAATAAAAAAAQSSKRQNALSIEKELKGVSPREKNLKAPVAAAAASRIPSATQWTAEQQLQQLISGLGGSNSNNDSSVSKQVASNHNSSQNQQGFLTARTNSKKKPINSHHLNPSEEMIQGILDGSPSLQQLLFQQNQKKQIGVAQPLQVMQQYPSTNQSGVLVPASVTVNADGQQYNSNMQSKQQATFQQQPYRKINNSELKQNALEIIKTKKRNKS